jgi:tetratricopeptide (TPR) repeat protein
MRGSPGETLASMQGGPNLGILPSSIMALEGPEVMGRLVPYQPGNVAFPIELMERGVPEDMVQMYRQSGMAIEPPVPPNLTESQTRDIVRRSISGRMPGPVGNIIARQAREAETARIGGMPAETDIFALEGPETAPAAAIAAALEPRARPAEVPPPVVPERAPAQLTREPKPFSTEEAFTGAMKAFDEASGQEDTGEKTVEDYMKEFSEVTGIDISGKPDKSAALMAFGLALMQNRAGSGFNVGNILRSVGEAGEKAIPELKAAKQEAKAARMAAGKYALEQIQAGRNARAALAAEQREFAREAFLKQMEIDAEAAKTAGQVGEIKNVGTIPVVQNLDIRRGMFDGRGVFVDGAATANTLTRGYNTANGALQTLSALEGAISEIAGSPSPAFTIIADRVNNVLAATGMKDPKVSFGEEGLSQEAKATALRDSIIQEFKRFLTSETGNGISNVDVANTEKLLGQIDLFGNPQEAIFRVRETRGLFEGKLQAISPFIEDAINDPTQYVNQSEYDRAMKVFNERLGENSPYNVTVTEGVPTVDVTGG